MTLNEDAATAPAAEVEKTATETAAKSATKPSKRAAKAAETPDFKHMGTVEELVSAYNEMVPTAVDLGIKKVTTVQMFVDTKVGVRACEQLHAAILKARDPSPRATKPKAEAEASTKEAEVRKTKKTTKSKARKSVKGKTRAARSKFDQEAKITWLGKDNPFREKSGRYERTEKVRGASGQTVKTYLAKGGRGGTLSYCVKHKLVKVG